jgi:glycosyltransferase involved in cell wall biosynthesis
VAVEQDRADPCESDLRVTLESGLPRSLPAGSATAIFCFGYCFHKREAVDRLELVVGGSAHRPTATRMPRRDLFEWLHSTHAREIGDAQPDPEGRSYRSGFWATVPIRAPEAPGWVQLRARARLASGRQFTEPLGRIEIVQNAPAPAEHDSPLPGTIAICLATFEPDIALFRAQVESLRAQTDERWRCLISDGGSTPAVFERILEVTADDPRFSISRSEDQLSPFHNFERALSMLPEGIELVALCDQDDRWYPDKLAVLRDALGPAQLVYSDQRLVTPAGDVLRDSLWQGRRNEYRNLASVLIANTMPGAAMLMRREVAELALPFPTTPAVQYHDHWIALVALATGEVRYVDRPLYDYVQHARAVSGDLLDRPTQSAANGRRGRFALPLAASKGWRAAYFCGVIPRQVQASTLLLRCGARLTSRKRHALSWFAASDRSRAGFVWLTVRPLRRLLGRGETLGEEALLVRGILWRWLIPLAAASSRRPGDRPHDASFPNPPAFDQPRLRRWRAGG